MLTISDSRSGKSVIIMVDLASANLLKDKHVAGKMGHLF